MDLWFMYVMYNYLFVELTFVALYSPSSNQTKFHDYKFLAKNFYQIKQ